MLSVHRDSSEVSSPNVTNTFLCSFKSSRQADGSEQGGGEGCCLLPPSCPPHLTPSQAGYSRHHLVGGEGSEQCGVIHEVATLAARPSSFPPTERGSRWNGSFTFWSHTHTPLSLSLSPSHTHAAAWLHCAAIFLILHFPLCAEIFPSRPRRFILCRRCSPLLLTPFVFLTITASARSDYMQIDLRRQTPPPRAHPSLIQVSVFHSLANTSL